MIVSELVAGGAQLHPIPRVPWPPRQNESPPTPLDSISGFSGYVVDLEVD